MTNELTDIIWWNSLRHEGLLLDVTRLGELYAQSSRELPFHVMDTLRIQKMAFDNDSRKQGEFIKFVLEKVCDFTDKDGHWNRELSKPSSIIDNEEVMKCRRLLRRICCLATKDFYMATSPGCFFRCPALALNEL